MLISYNSTTSFCLRGLFYSKIAIGSKVCLPCRIHQDCFASRGGLDRQRDRSHFGYRNIPDDLDTLDFISCSLL